MDFKKETVELSTGKKIEIKELSFIDSISLGDIEKDSERVIKLIELSISDNNLANTLTRQEGTELLGKINKLNGFVREGKDFLSQEASGGTGK